MDWRLISSREQKTMLRKRLSKCSYYNLRNLTVHLPASHRTKLLDVIVVGLELSGCSGILLQRACCLSLRPQSIPFKKNENRIASEDNFYQLRLSLVVGHALSRRDCIAGRRAAARRDGRRLAAHEGCGQSARREQFS